MDNIRQATWSDIDILTELSRRTFSDTFAAEHDPADIRQYLEETFSTEQFEDDLLKPESIFFLAYKNPSLSHQPIGYAHLVGNSSIPVVETMAKPIELVQLFVEHRELRKGHGSTLIQACLKYAVENGFETLWLKVGERNNRAQAFFNRWGFHQVGNYPLQLGLEIQNCYVLLRPVLLD